MRHRPISKNWFFSAALLIGLTASPSLAQYGNFQKAPIGGSTAAPRRQVKAQPSNNAAKAARILSTPRPAKDRSAAQTVHKADRGGHRSWQGYQPGYYSNRPPAYPGRNQPLPQPGVDYYPGANPYGYGYGFNNSYYYPGYYNNYQYNPGPNARGQGRGR